MAGQRKVSAPEFEFAAVVRITEQKPSVAEVTRRLGVTENRLHDWKESVAEKRADALSKSGHLTPLEDENRKLRAHVKRLEAERVILKQKPRRSSPPRRSDLRLGRGAQARVAGDDPVPRAGGVALGLLRLAISSTQRRQGRREALAEVHAEVKGRYGSPRMHAESVGRGSRAESIPWRR